ncbi:XP_029640870.1uncharacterized protein LOC115215717 [Octopus vulgaris]|uniref:XP_029640870.1uncharacterized protein LOC115215717 n=3 Tax=Octopus TaxID=6643 RepID=A0AA36F804_OCTVU|nr:uncharacterized protein LOC115215717 [Octopus sinensis]CAI9729186.1 XP_029640870.1uncharacterized protein LOC115215717 [Octopus vulgaris]
MWIILSMLLFSVTFTESLFFTKEKNPDEIEKAAQKGIDSKCLLKSATGDCTYYTCINDRYPCGSEGFAIRFGLYYCMRMRNKINSLNAAGRVWANSTLRCQSEALNPLYQSSSQSCKSISDAGFDAMHRCFIENNFCDINWDNRDAIWDIFDATDLGPGSAASQKMWSKVLKTSGSCLSRRATQFSDWLRERTESIGQVIEDFFRGILEKIKKSIRE